MTAPKPNSLLLAYHERTSRVTRLTLSEFVIAQAEATRGAVGFSYVPQRDAPNTYVALQAAFADSVQTGSPLPVSNEHSMSATFISPEVNYAMRFWHDINHCRHRLTFDLVDELDLALWHMSILEAEGFMQDSEVWQLLHAELLGSVYVMALTLRLPYNQSRFAEGCLTAGFDGWMLHALRKRAAEPSSADTSRLESS